MTAFWVTLAVLTVVTAVIKGVGPVVLGGRELPARFTGVVVLMAPALLTALVVTSAATVGRHWELGAVTIGTTVAAVLAWRRTSPVVTVVAAVIVTAGARLAGLQ